MKFLSVTWLGSYRREWIRRDTVAGLTSAAVVIPKAMAYAAIAGLSVEAGLYAALAAMLIYPLLGSSRPLSVTTTSAIAMLSATVIATTTDQTGTSPASVAATLALLVGGILIAAHCLKLGFLADFISLPVLIGFQAGVGVVIILGQIGAVLGAHIDSHSTLGILRDLPGAVTHTSAVTPAVAASGFLVMWILPRLLPRLPASLVWVTVSISASAFFGLGSMGVKTVGSVPPGLPHLTLPDLSMAAALIPGALGIALMSFTESVAAARAFRQRSDPPVNPNQELLAIGAANMGAAVMSGLPVGGGTSQTAINEAARPRSQMAQWVSALLVVLCLLVLSDAIALLPKAALAVLIIIASVHMIKPDDFRAIARVRYMEFCWALATFAGVLLLGTLDGILVAVAISVLSLFYQANHPPVYVVAYNPARNVFGRLGEDAGQITIPGLLILRAEGRINFANANNTLEKMRDLVGETKPQVIALECSAIPDIEYTALNIFTEIEQELRNRGITLWLVSVNPAFLDILKRSKFGTAVGEDRIFHNLFLALEAWERRADGGTKVQ